MPDPSREVSQPRRIVCFGDSVTQAVPYVAPEDTFARLLERRLNMRFLPEFEVSVANAGVGGENTEEGLARIDRAVLAHSPDVVTVEFGLNDIRYEPHKRVVEQQFVANLRRMYALLTEAGARVVFMTPTPIIGAFHVYSANTGYYDEWGSCDGLNAVYAELVREVARETGAPLADVYQVFVREAIEAEFRGETFDYRDLSILSRYINSRDGVHPTAAGQELIAAELYRVLVSEGVLVAQR